MSFFLNPSIWMFPYVQGRLETDEFFLKEWQWDSGIPILVKVGRRKAVLGRGTRNVKRSQVHSFK